MNRVNDYASLCGDGPQIVVEFLNESGKVVQSATRSGYLNSPDRTGGPNVGVVTSWINGTAQLVDGVDPIAPSVYFSLETYGGKADGTTDSTPAMLAAIKAAIASEQPAQITLNSGTYLFNCTADSPCFTISGGHHLSIVGQGPGNTKLLINQPRAGGFLVNGLSDNIYFSNFAVDYSVTPATQGTITAIGANFLTVSIDSGFRGPTDSTVFNPSKDSASFGMAFQNKSASPAYSFVKSSEISPIVFSNVTSTSFDVSYQGTGPFAIGQKFVYPVRNSQPTFSFYTTSNISFLNVTTYTAPDVALEFIYSTGQVVINNFQLLRNGNRVVTASGGAIWTEENSAKFFIENSHFEGMGDDIIDWGTQSYQVGAMTANSSFTPTALPYLNQIGQVLQIADVNGNFLGMTAISSITQNGSASTVGLASGGPALANTDYVFNRDLAAPGSLMVNNSMGTFRGGARVRSSGAIVQNNSFLDVQNGRFVVSLDFGCGAGNECWQAGPGLDTASGGLLSLPHFLGDSAGGVNYVMYAKPDANLTPTTQAGP